jgi:putative DNA primase/helicase
VSIGSLNWSLDGWKRLKERGYFVQPASAAAAQQDFEDLGSPIGAFIRDCCVVSPTASCRPETLYGRWLTWCNEQNIMHVGSVQTFGRDLRSVVSALKTIKPRNECGVQERFYEGVGLVDGEAQ